MRKRLSMVLLGATLASGLGGGCSQRATTTAGTSLPESAQAGKGPIGAASSVPAPTAPQSFAPVDSGMGKAGGDSGLGRTASEQTANPKGYFHEVESSNYLVAQNKTRHNSHKQSQGYAAGSTDEASPSGQPNPDPKDPKSADEIYQMAMAVPLSTFAADVDTASYANLRRSLTAGQKPSPESVRVEEMLNYFSYNLPEPPKGAPFSVTSELSDCPWNSQAKLLRLAIKTKSIEASQRPPCNLVFLLDVSGSMAEPNKLPLLKSSLKTLLDNLDDADRIAIVVYAGDSGLVLPSTPASDRSKILDAIDSLQSGGSTNGASGIELAYQVAKDAGTEKSVNRVILCTDGDFNVGPSSDEELKKLIEEKRKSGLSLSVLGFGHDGNDKIMETLADNGNGNYASIDSPLEARKVLVEEAGATLVTVAKDVKFQIAFNPLLVDRYRILGYQNRMLAAQDFDNDAKDAGDLGAGHAVTVLYEIMPPKSKVSSAGEVFNKLAGSKPSADQLAVLKLRYKEPTNDSSELMELVVPSSSVALAKASPDQRWAVAVTQFGLGLHGDPVLKNANLDQVMALAEGAVGRGDSYRQEFLKLVSAARKLPS